MGVGRCRREVFHKDADAFFDGHVLDDGICEWLENTWNFQILIFFSGLEKNWKKISWTITCFDFIELLKKSKMIKFFRNTDFLFFLFFKKWEIVKKNVFCVYDNSSINSFHVYQREKSMKLLSKLDWIIEKFENEYIFFWNRIIIFFQFFFEVRNCQKKFIWCLETKKLDFVFFFNFFFLNK